MNYDPKKTHLISRIREVLESQSLAGLATSSSDIPYLSLVAFAVTDDLRYILFPLTQIQENIPIFLKIPVYRF